jgi:hypothetical protein
MDKPSLDKPTAGLIDIIKSLYYNSNTGNTDERDKIIKNVEAQFSECDTRIDKYIRNSSKDLSRLIKVFNEIAKKIEVSRASISHSRESLKQCKILLQSKRDDVRRLWLDWCEQKYYYENISSLRRLHTASESIRALCAEKKYLEAAQTVAESTNLLDNVYSEVTGLHEIKRTIDEERIKLEKYLLQEMTEQLYTSVTRSVLETGTIAPTSSSSSSYKRRFRSHLSKSSNEEANIGAVVANGDSNGLDSYRSNETTIEKLVQAASKLNSAESNINIVEKMINDINKNINNQLILMINSTSTHVLESNLIDNSKLAGYSRGKQVIENNPKFLCQLIDLSFEQFKLTARYYRLFIEHASKQNQNKYQSGLIWSCVQGVLIQLLEEYLDIKQIVQGPTMTSSDIMDRLDLNSFFVRKRLLNLPFTSDSTPSNVAAMAQQSGQFGGGQAGLGGGSGGAGDDSLSHRMFTFRGSLHSMKINTYMREQNNENLFDKKTDQDGDRSLSPSSEQRTFKILVCQPDHRNITTIFSTMEHITKEIADEIRTLPADGQQQRPDNMLDKFLQEFILKTFITNAVESIKENARIHASSESLGASSAAKLDMSTQLISLSKQRELQLDKPILQNTLLVYQSCVDLFNLIRDMNSYASEFSRAMHLLIEQHYEYCNKLLLNLVSNNTAAVTTASGEPSAFNSENFVYSMVWVKDEGIKTYFKQLPAFSAAIKGKPSPAALMTLVAIQSGSNNSTILNASSEPNRQQPSTSERTLTNVSMLSNMSLNSHNPAVLAATVEVEQFDNELLSKEVETLIANLNDKELEEKEMDIITDFNSIEMIAHLHESCDWLISQLKYIVNSLEQMIKNPKTLNNSLSLSELSRLTKQMDELEKWRGDTLLLLYLETRVHCFYHLLNFIKLENNTSYAGDVDTDPDESVLSMVRSLHRIYEHLNRSLQENKVNYVFDALGFMIAIIFTKALKNFKKISTHGIAKMCRNIFHVEQNLSAIRMKSDPHLMKTHRFYELLYKKPEELLTHLIEHEAEFELNDYINLLNLIYRSQPGYEINSLSDNIQSLTNILKNKH